MRKRAFSGKDLRRFFLTLMTMASLSAALLAPLPSSAQPAGASAGGSAGQVTQRCNEQAGSYRGSARIIFLSLCLSEIPPDGNPPASNANAAGCAESDMSDNCVAARFDQAEDKLDLALREVRALMRSKGKADLDARLLDDQREWLHRRDLQCRDEAEAGGPTGMSYTARYQRCMTPEAARRAGQLLGMRDQVG